MDHPMIVEIERTGYPSGYKEPKHIGTDTLGYDLYEGDEVLILNDEIFHIESILLETVEALEAVGAERTEL